LGTLGAAIEVGSGPQGFPRFTLANEIASMRQLGHIDMHST